MKVLHINSYYNGSLFYKNLYDRQKEHEWDLSVFVPVSKHVLIEYDRGEYTTVSVNHHKIDRISFYYKYNKVYRDIIQKYDINAFSFIHAHSLFSNGYIAYKLKRSFGIPYIVAVRSTDVDVFFKYKIGLRQLGIQILEEAEKVICISPSCMNKLEKYVPSNVKNRIWAKTIIIPNAIDDFWHHHKAKEKIFSNDTISLLFMGRIIKQKNLATAIKTIRILNDKGYNATLSVIGEGPRENRNKKLCRRLKIQDKVSFHGYISDKNKLISVMDQCDIFLLPSYSETFGLVYIEAMSRGLPVIYTKNEGIDGFFEDGDVGYSVVPNEPHDIIDKIKLTLDNYKILSHNALIESKKFNWDNMAEKYITLYNLK